MRCRLAEYWTKFADNCLKDASAVQRSEMRKGFFMGAIAVLEIFALNSSLGDQITPYEESVFQDMHAELERFKDEMRRRAAEETQH